MANASILQDNASTLKAIVCNIEVQIQPAGTNKSSCDQNKIVKAISPPMENIIAMFLMLAMLQANVQRHAIFEALEMLQAMIPRNNEETKPTNHGISEKQNGVRVWWSSSWQSGSVKILPIPTIGLAS